MASYGGGFTGSDMDLKQSSWGGDTTDGSGTSGYDGSTNSRRRGRRKKRRPQPPPEVTIEQAFKDVFRRALSEGQGLGDVTSGEDIRAADDCANSFGRIAALSSRVRSAEKAAQVQEKLEELERFLRELR